ncbi:SURF1 family cytochrome oxidase biogenesis protein [Microbacterium thalli]|uniref:SURF1-like protein n=1 Tax=Microbacterium thalli TaxID=3027921 RepID=A0ABT5SI32_9MICO|nr:SURF1 family protein [Microbacterium thalli]MDD7930145.1 SURF1 family protein [Microbacterium thalli]MDD7962470.1 SURF1 family protein [Microbacterium thalli]MDN8549431.1 SURF1 family protein [Microbacterium thalli]
MTGKTAARWAGYVAVAIAFAVACAYLSNWQFTRNEDRSAQLALVEANYDAEPAALGELLPPDGALDPADEWHPVTMAGEYLADDQVLVRNRPHGGTSAFEVLVPFRTTDGRVFVVNRGWVPPGRDSPEPDAIAAPPTGTVTVVARLKPAEAAPTSGRSAPDGQVPTINLDLVAAEADLTGDVVTSAYGLLVSEDPAPAESLGALPTPSEDPGPHLSYAIQWILFAIMGFVFIWYMIRTERRHRREDEEDAAAAGLDVAASATADPVVPASLRRRRDGKRDRDMADEDAILDSSRR